MSVLWVDGWDFGDALHLGGQVSPFFPTIKYTSYNRINVTVVPGAVLPGFPGGGMGNAINLGNSGFGQQTFTNLKYQGNPKASWCAGFARKASVFALPMSILFRYEAGGATIPGGLGGGNASTALMLAVLNDSTVSVFTGPDGTASSPGTLLWNSAGVYTFPFNVWQYLELGVNTDTGAWFLYANDVLLHQDISGLIPPGIDRYSILQNGFEDNDIDDHYAATTRLGPCRVTGFPPNFGSTNQWSPLAGTNLSQVQEFGNRPGLNTPDDNQSYVEAVSGGLIDLYGFAAPACYGRILALALNADGSAIAGSPAIDYLIKLAGTTYNAGSSGSYIGGYGIQQGISELNPLTGTFWTDADIAGGLFGFQSGGLGDLRITQWMMEKLVSLRAVRFDCGQGSYSFTS